MSRATVGPDLPAELRTTIDALLHGVSQNEVSRRATAMSAHYRSGGKSDAAINDVSDIAAYAVSRLPATYAAVCAALSALRARIPDFAPRTLLDAGAGLGAASWAAAEIWPDLAHIRMLEANSLFITAARKFLRASSNPALCRGETVQGDILDRRASLPPAELVIGSYVLGELAEDAVAEASRRLWNACRGVLVIVEPGTPKGYGRILMSRRSAVDEGGHVAAPCPHSAACPLQGPDWCHFTQRLNRSRAHQRAKSASLSFEDEKFAYVAVARRPPTAEPGARILTSPSVTKAEVAARLCAADGVGQLRVRRRDKARYQAAKKWRWGDMVDPTA